MSAGEIGKTEGFKLSLVDFDWPRWHDFINGNFVRLDAVLRSYITNNILGSWKNSTTYEVGDKLLDDDAGLLFTCAVNHTSAATGTFAQDRIAHPTYWNTMRFEPSSKGEWQTATTYGLGDFVSKGYEYAYCVAVHVSNVWATDKATGYWEVLIDTTPTITAANSAITAANAAVTSASASASAAASSASTATSKATEAANSATSAGTQATNASNSALAAAASASTASTKATEASNAATAAATSASNAATSASSAAGSASAAADSATSAATSASNVSTVVNDNAIKYSAAQSLTAPQKVQARANLGLGSAAIQEAGTAANQLLKLDETGKIPAVDASQLTNLPPALNRAVAVNASGTAIDFTGTPATAKKVTVVLSGVSTNGAAGLLIQLGDAASIKTTGYSSSTTYAFSNGNAYQSPTNGIGLFNSAATQTHYACIEIYNVDGNTWVASGNGQADPSILYSTTGVITLASVLTRLRLTTANGTDTFDAGKVNIFWE